MIRSAKAADAGAVAAIYNHYVTDTVVTFEEEPLSADDMATRLAEVEAAGLPWLVAEEQGQLIGYAYAGEWKGRCAYRYSVEVSVYLSPRATGQGCGTRLYRELFARLAAQSMHVVIGGITLPNPASIALHEKFGMEQVAHFREVGFKAGRWLDVGYWQGFPGRFEPGDT